jgi:ubiquinone/menaquinone biosynthesis C-methylase UbiE
MSDTGTSVDVAQYSGSAAGVAFDHIAHDYDQIFTDSLIGRAQRNAVWEVLIKSFQKNENVLELNCGTGEDAIFLADTGVSVFACDASPQMIERAEQRFHNIVPRVPVVFYELPTERIGELHPDTQFDGAFSNFSGLNCIADLEAVASSLAKLIKPGGRLVFCFSTRFCLVEMLYFLVRGQWQKAARRWNGSTRVTLGNAQFRVYYPTIRRIRRAFAPEFCLYDLKGIGVTIPPSYLEGWARRHPGVFRLLCRLEGLFAGLPLVRATGDHVLLCFEKVSR